MVDTLAVSWVLLGLYASTGTWFLGAEVLAAQVTCVFTVPGFSNVLG